VGRYLTAVGGKFDDYVNLNRRGASVEVRLSGKGVFDGDKAKHEKTLARGGKILPEWTYLRVVKIAN
jgi:hypothetical protein